MMAVIGLFIQPRLRTRRTATTAERRKREYASLAVGVGRVKAVFEQYGRRDERVKFLEGWFRDTLPTAPVERLAVLRLDGDLYESTMDGLANLYLKVSPGGFVIVDDYGTIEACRGAGSTGPTGRKTVASDVSVREDQREVEIGLELRARNESASRARTRFVETTRHEIPRYASH